MRTDRTPKPVWLLIVVAAVFMAFVTCGQTLLSTRMRHQSEPFAQILIPSMAIWFSWALIAPVVLFLARRFRFDRAHAAASIAVHFASAVACAMLVSTSLAIVTKLLIPSMTHDSILERAETIAALQMHTHIMVYCALLALYTAAEYYQRNVDQTRIGLELEAQLATAHLHALKSQLQPHFLFNTLHSIGALIAEDPVAARRMLALIGDLLRLTLEDNRNQQVHLRREVEMLQLYLQIESLRFQDRLTCDVLIEPGLMDVAVPPFILQPLVENAIRHGIAHHSFKGIVRITITRGAHDELLLDVFNDCPPGDGTSEIEPRIARGIGLATTRERLERLYGSAASLSITRARDGVHAVIRQPARELIEAYA